MTRYPSQLILTPLRVITSIVLVVLVGLVGLAVLVVLVGLGSIGNVASADNTANATKLFSEAVALKDAGKYAEACGKFAESFEVDKQAGRPAPGTQLNLGECAEREGQLRKAYLLFDDAAADYSRRMKAAEASIAKDPNSAELKRDFDRAQAGMKLARERATALGPKLAKVVVRIAEPNAAGLSVKIGDRTVAPAAEVVDYFDTGNVAITVSAPGHEPFTTSARAESGKAIVVDVPSLARVSGARPIAEPSAPTPPTSRRQRKRVLIAASVGGGGVVVLGISTVLGLGAKSDYNDAKEPCASVDGKLVCPTQADRDAVASAFRKADVATVLGIGGLALVGVGAYLYFTAPREGVVVTPMASSSAAGVSISGRF